MSLLPCFYIRLKNEEKSLTINQTKVVVLTFDVLTINKVTVVRGHSVQWHSNCDCILKKQ